MDILKGAMMERIIITVFYKFIIRPPYQGWQNGQIQKANIKICRTNAGG